MALIACQECKAEVSSTAKTCPKCGARPKPASKTWLWVVGVVVLFFVFLVFKSSNDPEFQAKQAARRTLDTCLADLNDPLKDPGAKATIIRPVCERMRREFIEKFGHEP